MPIDRQIPKNESLSYTFICLSYVPFEHSWLSLPLFLFLLLFFPKVIIFHFDTDEKVLNTDTEKSFLLRKMNFLIAAQFYGRLFVFPDRHQEAS